MERSAFILGVKHSLTLLGALGFEDEATSRAKRRYVANDTTSTSQLISNTTVRTSYLMAEYLVQKTCPTSGSPLCLACI